MKTRRAFSYARFSSAKQADGYSLARQLESAQRYCERNGLVLDKETFLDSGVSGFKGSNSAAGELADFIDRIQSGRIPKGSVLIIENVDRLSRLPPSEANRVITDIVKSGIDLVTTSPEMCFTARNLDQLATWLPLQISQALAHEESLKKSDRVKDAWKRKRATLAERKPVSRKCPFWLKPSADGKSWVVKDREAELMRNVFKWCIEGLGAARICERLHKDYPTGITGKGWQPNNLRKLMRSRQVLGEFQPRTGTTARKGGVPSTLKDAGAPIKNYFPAVVSEADFYKVEALLKARTAGGGRTTGTPNIFSGLAVDAWDKQPMVLACGRNKRRVLVSRGAIRKVAGSEFRCISYDVFEAAILLKLKELKLADVVGKATESADEVEGFSAKLTQINHRIKTTQDRAAKADDPTVYLDLLDTLGTERKAIVAGLEAAKAKAANPASDVLGETVSLVELLADAEGDERDELRRRARAALLRLVKAVRVLVVPVRRGVTGAVAQVEFVAGGVREYAIFHRAKRGATPADSAVLDFLAGEEGTENAPLDFSRKEDVALAEEFIRTQLA